jgi:adenine-specific DNA methylase
MTPTRISGEPPHDLQLSLLEAPPSPLFPATRYQGSKAKLAPWIWQQLKGLTFDTALDAFGGTACIAHLLKRHGKEVTYNDLLRSNYLIGLAMVENDSVELGEDDLEFLLSRHRGIAYPDFIQRTFPSIYFTDAENTWLDMVVTNVRHLEGIYKQALAYFALFQACLVKRPFNLFHRNNLYLRTADVPRTFGNKATWDAPFPVHLRRSVETGNRGVFSNGRGCRAINKDALAVSGDYDLVYVDTPYIGANGVGVDYLAFYHFLEGLADYDGWGSHLDFRSRHRAFKRRPCDWCDRSRVQRAFDALFDRFRNSIVVVSYRADGIPSIPELLSLLRHHKHDVRVAETLNYRYVLSKRRSAEVLIVAR